MRALSSEVSCYAFSLPREPTWRSGEHLSVPFHLHLCRPASCYCRFFTSLLENFDLDHDGSLEPTELSAMFDVLGVGIDDKALEVRENVFALGIDDKTCTFGSTPFISAQEPVYLNALFVCLFRS